MENYSCFRVNTTAYSPAQSYFFIYVQPKNCMYSRLKKIIKSKEEDSPSGQQEGLAWLEKK